MSTDPHRLPPPVDEAAERSVLDWDDELDAFLDDTIEEVPAEGVPDAEVADRIVARVARIDRDIRRVKDTVARRVALLRQWETGQVHRLEAQRANAERHLEGWARAVHEQTGQITWSLPAGKIELREARTRVELDPAAGDVGAGLIAAGHADLVNVETVRKVPKDRVKGVAVPGDRIERDHQLHAMVLDRLPPLDEDHEYRWALVEDVDTETGEVYRTPLPGVVLAVGTRRTFAVRPR